MKENLSKLKTENRNERTMDIDLLSVAQILEIMNDEDNKVIATIKEALPQIEALINETIAAYKKGGRIIYIGAGTSGRLGLMDAVEVVPTFNSDRFVGLIAGGEHAFVKAVEGAEDSKELAVSDLKALGLNEKDFVIGVAASGRTPYVLGGVEFAKKIDAATVGVSCVENSKLAEVVDISINPITGAEVITGSTRMKAGTATKMILNMLTTGAMIKIGKVYGNLMVDVRATNEKLRDRACRIVMAAVNCTEAEAVAALEKCSGHAKSAINFLRKE